MPPSDEVASDDLLDEDHRPDDDEAIIPPAVFYTGLIAGTPLLLLGVAATGIVGYKRRRRSRRRRDGTLRDRVAGGWSELQDLARDMGNPFPRDSTRRESAGFIGNDEVGAAAEMADLATFGPEPPNDADVDYYWDKVDHARTSMVAGLGRLGRMRVSVTPTSVLTDRRRTRGDDTDRPPGRRRKKVLVP